MKEEISKNIIKQLCNDFVDTICVGLEEYPDEFPYTFFCHGPKAFPRVVKE